jgi:uncharacterized membrane protein
MLCPEKKLSVRGEGMTTALRRSLFALGVGLAVLVASLAVGVSGALAGPSFPSPYALKSNWGSVNVVSVVAVIVAVIILQFVLIAVALRRRQQMAPALAETTSLSGAKGASTSEETRKAA